MSKSAKSGKTHVIPQVTPPFVRLAMMAGFSWAALVALARALPVVQTVFYDMPLELISGAMPTPTAQLLAVPGYPDDPERMTFIARLYLPDAAVHGAGPYPVVLFLHGSGGLWSSNNIPANISTNNAPSSQFRDWGNLLVGMGYACLFPDSLHPRGITGSFEGKRPHYDPAEDDAACSPNYERPKDIVAALEYIVTRSDLNRDRLAWIGFSHGSQTGMNALLDASVDLGDYEVDYIDLVDDANGGMVEDSVKKPVPGPVRIPAHLPMPRFCAFYYGGGGHFGYHGQSSSTAAGRYMLDRRTTAILFHGSDDYLLSADHDLAPIGGSLFPIKQVLASAAQAASLALPNPIARHYLMDRCDYHAPADARVSHSFDLGSVTLAAPEDWDTAGESPNQKARRLARDEVLRWLDFKLGPAPILEIHKSPEPPHDIGLSWPTRPRLAYSLESGPIPGAWEGATPWTNGTGNPSNHPAPVEDRMFFRLRYRTADAPINEPQNAGFFLTYDDFAL